MGPDKNDAVANGSPFRTGPLKTITDAEEITFDWSDWSDWYNNRRLRSMLGYIPLEEYEATYSMLKTRPHQPITSATKRGHENRDSSKGRCCG